MGIAHAEEVAKILRQNVVQGQQVDEEGERYRTLNTGGYGLDRWLTAW